MSQKFKKAKFRGLEFYLSESEGEFGRRTELHEFPKKNIPYSEDLGRKARSYPIEGYIIGDDAEDQRDALIAAAEEEGPGILIHPKYGQILVTATLRVRETVAELRFVRLNWTFTEAGEINFPAVGVDTTYQLKKAGEATGLSAIADFAKKFSTKGRPQFLVDSAVAKIKDVTATIGSLTGSASSVYRASADVAFALRGLNTSVNDLLNNPAELGKQLRNSFNLLAGTFDSILGNRTKLAAYSSMLSFGSSEPVGPGTTSNRAQEEQNRQALNDLIQRLALEQASYASAEVDYTNLEDAVDTRNQLLDAIDSQEASASDDMYGALIELRAKIVQSVPGNSKDLPNLVTYMPSAMINSLALTYDLYGNVDSESDIIARNHISNPALIPGGKALEVLAGE